MDVVTEGLGTSSHLCNVLQFFFLSTFYLFLSLGHTMGGEEKMGHRKRPSDLDRKFVGGDREDDRAEDLTQQEILPRCQVYVGVFCFLLCIICTSERDQLEAHFSGKRRAPVLPPFLPVFGNIHCTAAQPSRRLNTKLYLDQAIIVFELRVLCGIVVCRKISKQSNNLKT